MVVGFTVSVSPLPAGEPPQVPVYQYQPAPVPNVPPVVTITELNPLIIVAGVAVNITELVETLFTVIVICSQEVVLHMPSALTKYSVVTVGLTEGAEPATSSVPPHEPLYQYQFAPDPELPPETPSVVVLPWQMVVELAVAELAETE